MKLLIRHWMDWQGNNYYKFDDNTIKVINAEKLDLQKVEISLETQVT